MLNTQPVKQANLAPHNNGGMGKRSKDEGTTDLGMRIKARRLELDWKQEELARKAGCSKSAVSQWETGDVKNLQLSRLVKVADALDLEIRYLITGQEPRLRVNRGATPIYDIELDAIRRLQVAEPDFRRYVLSLATLTAEQQKLMIKTMREAVPDSVVEAAYGRPPGAKNK